MDESEKDSNMFRPEAKVSISSPEQLDSYIKVANPSLWVTLAAVVLFLIVVIVWSFTGTLIRTVDCEGIVRDGAVDVFISSSERDLFYVGQSATVLDQEGAVIESLSTVPVSKKEASEGLANDYEVSQLEINDWNYVARISLPMPIDEGEIVPVRLDHNIKPITLIFGSR